MKSQKTMFFLFITCLFVIFAVSSPPANAQCVPTGPEGPFGNASCEDWIDNDCDGLTDTADTDCYNYVGNPDIDDDGDGKTENEFDCNDGDATIYTGATRICDAKDNNCDGRLDFSTDVDNDNDGYAKCVDCADGDPNINPGVVEGGVGSAVCTDGKDNDCDYFIDLAELACQDPCIDGDTVMEMGIIQLQIVFLNACCRLMIVMTRMPRSIPGHWITPVTTLMKTVQVVLMMVIYRHQRTVELEYVHPAACLSVKVEY
jgi:hypothetical protein